MIGGVENFIPKTYLNKHIKEAITQINVECNYDYVLDIKKLWESKL